MTDPIVESKIAEAAQAAAVAHEANANAREAQMHETLVHALREVLVDGASEERPLLIKRIPFICNDIVSMKQSISDINDNLKWGVRIVIGAVIVAVMALLFK
jgi:hypothetical protein